MELINANTPLKAVDFFCSAGGVTSGFRQAGIKVLGGIDNDLSCKLTYEYNNPEAQFIHTDIVDLSVEELANKLHIGRYDDNLIFIGCSPCQYYSLVNTTKEKSAKSKMLLEEFWRFVDYYRPGYIFIENVPGLRSKEGSPLSHFKMALHEWGYEFNDKVINANEYGVPQSRKRYVLVASRLGIINVPEGERRDDLTVRNYIGLNKGFEEIPAGYRDSSEWMHTVQNLMPINMKRMLETAPDGGNRLAWKNNPELQLKCYEGRDDQFVDVYGRMYWDKPSPTITTKFYSITNGRFGHPEQNRAISLREGAVLQSFPRDYKFHSTNIATIARMIGNAVPPKLAESIGNAFVKHRQNATI